MCDAEHVRASFRPLLAMILSSLGYRSRRTHGDKEFGSDLPSESRLYLPSDITGMIETERVGEVTQR